MDAITLKPMRLTRSVYPWLLMKAWLRKAWWLHAVFVGVGACAFLSAAGALRFHGLVLFSLPVIRMVVLAAWASRKDNQQVNEERRFTVDADRFVGTTSSGARSEVPWSYVVRVSELDRLCQRCTSAGRMPIPAKPDLSGTDAVERFRRWIAARPAA
ncbi:MAG: hypothetical protein QY325_10535 [Flavobacteriales bacterium]|jgi:hypothetical protein|nr:MAG: hypothetical protein QY325_10535 [Flavobacteriales bacterium]